MKLLHALQSHSLSSGYRVDLHRPYRIIEVDVGERQRAGLREGGVSLRERGAVTIRSRQRDDRLVVRAGDGDRQRFRRCRAVFVGDLDAEGIGDSLAFAQSLDVVGVVV